MVGVRSCMVWSSSRPVAASSGPVWCGTMESASTRSDTCLVRVSVLLGSSTPCFYVGHRHSRHAAARDNTPPPSRSADVAFPNRCTWAVFEQLANAGVAVYCFDVHGHGASEPKEASERGLIRSYKHLVRWRAIQRTRAGARAAGSQRLSPHISQTALSASVSSRMRGPQQLVPACPGDPSTHTSQSLSVCCQHGCCPADR